jgi:hypothetical protein
VGPAEFLGDISRIQTGRAPGDPDEPPCWKPWPTVWPPQGMFDAFGASSPRLQAWVDNGRGVRPPGRLRTIRDPELSALTRLWAGSLYRVVHDPDGRPKALRKRP